MRGSYLQADHLWRRDMLLLFALWGCLETAAWHHPICLPMSAFDPHPVQGFWELLRNGNGCISRECSTSGQEVHVISLHGGVPSNAQVTLVLGPDSLHRAPILVLRSQEPVHWMLPSPPGKNWTFQVSPGSCVSALEPVASTETNFPETSRGLLQWARRKHGGVTSLVEYHEVNTIYVLLGADDRAPATCKLRRNVLITTHFASERQLRPLNVCLNPDPPRDLEVHIILSKGVTHRPSLAYLTVELHAVRRSPRQGLLLILKNEGDAQWMVRPHRLTGQLHVLVWAGSAPAMDLQTQGQLVLSLKSKASHKVIVSRSEMDQSLMVTQRTSSRLAYVKDPVQWAAEQKLPAFTSYTEAERVNRFLLVVGMNEPTQEASEDAKPFGPMFLPSPRVASSQHHFPEAFSVGWRGRQAFLGEDRSAAYPLLTTKVSTEGAESVQCLGEQKPIHESKETQRVSYVSTSPTLTSSSEDTAGFQDLPFHLGHVLLSLDVYSSEAFAKQPGPCTVPANSRVFVEAALAAYDLYLGFTIQQCFISPSSDPSLSSPYLLVQHGCAADAQVIFSQTERATQGRALPPGYQERQRLSFVIQPRSNDSIQFLHCQLTLCSKESWASAKSRRPIPKCQSQNDACMESREEAEMFSAHFQRTITKPIIVTVEAPPRVATPAVRPDNFLSNEQGKVRKDATHSRKSPPPPTAAGPGLQLPAVVGIAFSAFIIGISLTGGLWFIHSKTDPEETAVPKPLAPTSGPAVFGNVPGSVP